MTILPAIVRADDVAPTLAGRTHLTIPGDAWKLLWHDEFDGAKLDTAKWRIGLPWSGTDGEGRHHNDHYASYIMDDDVAVRDGQLHLTTQRRDVTDKRGRVFRYTQGMVTTHASFRVAYGYFEIRAKMPVEAGAGTWPAFWMLAEGWPPEFDVIEYWGSDNRIHQGTVTKRPDGTRRWESFHRQNASLTGWHTYGLEWGPGYQIYNIDGEVNLTIHGAHVPDVAHYLLLNSGVDAQRPPRPGTIFPNDFVVDYVRVYARPDVPALLNAGFEQETLFPWSRFNESTIVDYDARTGTRCLRVDAGGATGDKASSAAQQTVHGLKPATTYTLTAFTKTTGTAVARLGVKEHGGDETRSEIGDGPTTTPAAGYRPLRLTFITGPESTSATVYCWTEGEGTAFFDDVQWVAD